VGNVAPTEDNLGHITAVVVTMSQPKETVGNVTPTEDNQCYISNVHFSKLRLSPEEQELAYELKVQMMRSIEVQNNKLKTELGLHSKMDELRVTTPSLRSRVEETNLSRTNLVKLMRLYEKKANEGRFHVILAVHSVTKCSQVTFQFQPNFT
jgi:hypothetical protein